MRKIDILKNAQDFMVIGQSNRDKYVYAAKPSLDIMGQFYEKSISNPNDKDIPAFQRHWQFDKQKGITGSSAFLALRFDKQALRPNGLWLPSLLEGKALDSQGKLSNDAYRDFGVAGYSIDNPNKEIAEILVPRAKELGFETPLIVPFRAMDYRTESGKVKPFFVESPQGIIQGKEAQRKIDSLDYKGNSGVRGLGRYSGGGWYVVWYDLVGSYGGGRVDWVCGEATRKILGNAYSELSERNYGKQIQTLKEKQKADKDNFRKSLKS